MYMLYLYTLKLIRQLEHMKKMFGVLKNFDAPEKFIRPVGISMKAQCMIKIQSDIYKFSI